MTKSRRQRKQATTLPSWMSDAISECKSWCQGRMWLPRLLLLFFFLHIMVCHLKQPDFESILKGLNLGFHELGHMVFGLFGNEFITVAGGSLLQCLVPLLSIIMFFRQRDYFGIAFCFGWESSNLFDVAVYADDARKLELPLVSPFSGGGETIHDWNYMLDKLNMLQYDYMFAGTLRILAVVSMLICLGFGFFLVYNMMKTPKKANTQVV